MLAQTEFNAEGFDVMRVEDEAKLAVPDEIVDSVWSYLSTKYGPGSTYLTGMDSSFTSKIAEDIFVDQYFDNADLQLIKGKNGIRHRTRTVLTNANDRKNGRELVQIKITGIEQGNELARAEYKYPVQHYSKVEEPHDDHPFLGIVERENRQDVIDRLKQYEIDALSIFPTILIEQRRQRVYVLQDNNPFATITLDHVTGKYKDKTANYVEMELELNEIAYTEADSSLRTAMKEVQAAIQSDITTKFPQIKQDQTPKYNKAFNAMGITGFEGPPSKSSFGYIFIGICAAVGLVLVFFLVRKPKRRKVTV